MGYISIVSQSLIPSPISLEIQLRECQNEPSVTATKKVCHYGINIMNTTYSICENRLCHNRHKRRTGEHSISPFFVVVVVVVLILSYLLQVRNSVQAPVAQRYTTTSMSDPHDAPVSSSPYLCFYSYSFYITTINWLMSDSRRSPIRN